MTNDHRKIYRVTGRAILDIMQRFGDVPTDAEYIDCHYYPETETFGVKVHSPTFDRVPENAELVREEVTIRNPTK